MPDNNENTFSIEEFNKYWNSLTITDDFIFCKVFEEEELCKEMLEILLDIKIHHLEYPDSQKGMKSSHLSKGIRLDVFVQDSNRVFDVEIQNADEDNLPFRTRYYHSTMDTSLLKKGNLYTELKESYVIFLCKFDPINKGKPVYHFSMRDEQNPEIKLGDKTHTILYNMCDFAKLKEGARKDFLNYLAHGVKGSSFTSKLEKRVSEVKNDEDWRIDYMTLEMKFLQREKKAVEQAVASATLAARNEGIAQGIQKGAREQKKEIAKQMLLNNMSKNDIQMYTGLSLEEIEAL